MPDLAHHILIEFGPSLNCSSDRLFGLALAGRSYIGRAVLLLPSFTQGWDFPVVHTEAPSQESTESFVLLCQESPANLGLPDYEDAQVSIVVKIGLG